MAKKKKKEGIRLHMGCGSNVLDGWYNTDIFPTDERVRFQDATQPFSFEDESFGFIFSEHMFEHIPFLCGVNMLKECYRVLKPGGVFRLSLPTLDFLIKLWIAKDDEDVKDYIDWSLRRHDISSCVDTIKGPKACFVINNFYRLWGHMMIYDVSTIIEMLKNAGFSEVKVVPNDDSEYSELKSVNGHWKIISKKYNDIETTTFEAKK